jgi:3-carboxy-cis,cis-muconate cycloisomerase
MKANLEITNGLSMAESMTTRLVPALGRLGAHDVVEQACRRAVEEGRALRDVLRETPAVTEHLGADEIDAALAPEHYLGVAGTLIDRALAAHAEV